MKLYVGLLFLGLVLVGVGLWFLFNPGLVPAVEIPEEEPVITMHTSFRTIGNGPNHLRIYQDGVVIYTEEKGIGSKATRTWRTGNLEAEELAALLAFFSDSNFESLDAFYEFPGEPSNGSTRVGGMSLSIIIDFEDLQKGVSARQYLSPDGGMTYPDMPYPLNEIYKRLKDIAENRTEEVYRESL